MTPDRKLTPEEEEMLDRTFGLSPERKKAKQEKEKEKAEPDPDSVEAEIKRIFG